MQQVVYRDCFEIQATQMQTGAGLGSDGTGLPDEIGYMLDATTLSGSGTFGVGITFTTPIELITCQKRAVMGSSPLMTVVIGVLTLSLIDGDLFRYEHSEDIDEITISGNLVGLDHPFLMMGIKDGTATVHTLNWSSLNVAGTSINLRWGDGIEPTPTPTANALDFYFIFLKNGLSATGSHALDVGSDPTSRLQFNPRKLLEGAVTICEHTFSEHRITVTKRRRIAVTPIRVEGDAVIGAIQKFGSEPSLVTAFGVNLDGNQLSECEIDTLVDTSSQETNFSVVSVTTVVEIDLALGRKTDMPHTEDISLSFLNAPTDLGNYVQHKLLLLRDSSATDRLLDQDVCLIDGVSSPIVWEGKTRQPLRQELLEVTSITMLIFTDFVFMRVVNNVGAGT
jgi:hypothetical protein